MTFDEWFDAEHPITSVTNLSLRYAHHEIAKVAWEAALTHHEPAQAQVSDAGIILAALHAASGTIKILRRRAGLGDLGNEGVDETLVQITEAITRLSTPLPDGRS